MHLSTSRVLKNPGDRAGRQLQADWVLQHPARPRAIPAFAIVWVALAVVTPAGVRHARASEAPPAPAWDPFAPPGTEPLGDTLTVIQRPLLNFPAFVVPGGSFTISCDAPAGTTGWGAELVRGARRVALEVTEAAYEPATRWWRLWATAPADARSELYDLHVSAAGGLDDVTRHAVKVLPSYRTDYYFVHITDPHLPTHLLYDTPGARGDSASTVDLREVIRDVNIINPEFVLLTGDLVNEGELEDFQQYRYYSRAQRMLGEFQVPVFLTSGNHDLGGWAATPPSAGTARRAWWRFFGWKRLAAPPPGAPVRTQDYSFDYGSVHYVGLEAYINYDDWRSQYYGRQSFIPAQLQWLGADLAAASGSASRVLFYHDDFGDQLDLGALGVEMALWGHIHHDRGGLTTRPYNLATGTTADGQRTYRVIRVSNGVLTPMASVGAGGNGERLRAEFSPANDGTHASITAVVTNGFSLRFENARLRFFLPTGTGDVEVVGGTLIQTDDSGSVRECTVGFDLPANAMRVVEVRSAGESPVTRLQLAPNLPNPFREATVIRYDLPTAGRVELSIFAPDGRKVVTLVDADLAAGPQTAVWEGRDALGRRVSSGAYRCRLVTPDGIRTRGLSLVR